MEDARNAPQVSVIVPVYNVAAFLDQCLASITAQTLREIEVICLNDGSTDESLSIMKRHAKTDGRIRVIDKENEGYGATCNCGIELARGRYVAIVEPDDYVLPDMYSELLAFADSFGGVDIAKEAWFDVLSWDDSATERVVPGYLYKRLRTSKVPCTIDAVPALLEGHPSIWSALYRREFLVDEGIRFEEYPGAGWADNPFLVDTLCRAGSIVYLDAMHYCYRNELPRKAGAPLDERRLSVPLDRWMEMTERMRSCGMESPAVWRAHCQRGFNYIDDVVAQGGWESEMLRLKIAGVLAAMDADLVLGHPKLSPAKKRFYQKQTGRAAATKVSAAPYALHLAREFFLRARAQGVREAVRALGAFSHRTPPDRNAGR